MFGRMPVPDYVFLLSRHTAHHAGQIPGGAGTV